MRHSIAIAVAATLSFAVSEAHAQQAEPAAPAPPPAAAAPAPVPAPAAAPPGAMPMMPVKSKWSITLSGFFQADSIYDTTQSFTDAATGTPVARPGTYAARNDRVSFGIRNSRLGFKLVTPEVGGLRPSGFVEFDFLGNLTPPLTETQLFSNPAMRARHVYAKLDNDYLTLL